MPVDNEVRRDFIEERSAIMEYDGKIPRAEAERRAAIEWSDKVSRAERASIAKRKQNNGPTPISRKDES